MKACAQNGKLKLRKRNKERKQCRFKRIRDRLSQEFMQVLRTLIPWLSMLRHIGLSSLSIMTQRQKGVSTNSNFNEIR